MADKFTERENYILGNSINIEWFLEAINKNNPLHPEEGAAHTESYELNGQNILVPRVRIKNGKAILNKENALEEALEKGDYIIVPEGEDPDQYSKDLSALIGKFRGFNKGGLADQMDSMLPAVDDDTRSTEEYLEDTKPMDISSVPAFQRPMDASENDQLVGEDDAGNPVYRTMLGNTYTVRRSPDQRTTRTKIEEDVLPAVKDWLQNPEAPSQEQVVQMGKAIAESVYDLVSIPGDLATGKRSASDVTLGDVYDTTGMMAVGSLGFEVPEGALRTFGGKGAKDLDVSAFAQARELMKDGAQRINPKNPEQFYDLNKKVWWETGWYIDPNDNQWRFEIDDSKSEITLGKLPLTEKELKESGGEFKLSEVFSHDELYKQYPHLKDITVRFYHPSIGKNSTEKKDSVAGYMNSQEGILAINTKNNTPRQMKKTILHEIQHSIQNYEGFTPGANSDYIDPSVLSKGENKIQGQIADLYSENINLKVNNAKLLGPDFNKSVSVDDAFPRGLARFYANEGYTVDQIRMDLLDRQRDYLDKFMNQHPNVQELQDSGAAGQVTENLKKLRENILKETGFRSGLPRLATEYYMGAGGEIESRLVELSSYMSSSDRRTGTGMYRNNPRPFEDYGEPDTPGFPLDRVTGMLASEGRDNKLMFRGEEGVDAVAQARRAIPTENIGSSDIYLDIPRNDFRVQRDSEGVVIKPKKGKHLFPAVDKLKSLFKDEKSVLDVLNLKKDDTFTFEGKDYKFQKIGIHTVGKDELDRNQFLLSPEEGDNYARVVTVIAEDSLGRTNYIGLSKFLDDPEKYIGKDIPKEKTEFLSGIRNKLGFAEGGTVDMNQQMSFAFEDGGLRDDGMMRDPVSGNEVPPGSTAKEVRDDIPAQLSEGEYVVPADVVRYYGVKFFEDLRDNAKMGLQDMEARGRIGGEPVPAGGPMNDDDLSPEELAAIQEMMGMAEGGVVNMYKQQQDLYSPPNPAIGNPTTTGMATGGEVRGYNSSSVVTNPMTDQSVLEAGQQAQQRGFVGFPLGATIFPSATTGKTVLGPSGTQVATTGNIGQATTGTTGTTTTTDTSALTTVTLYGPNGEIITLTLPTDTDRYNQLLSEGWTTEMPVAGSDRDSATGTKTGPDTDPSSWMDNFDYNDFNKLKDQTSENLTRIPFGGVIGTLSNATKAAQSAANIIVMKANGFDTADLEKELGKFKKETGLNLLPNELINGDRLALDIIRNNPGADLGIDKKATDLEGNFIFKSKGEWDDFMQEIAPPNMTYNPATESYVSDGSSGGGGGTLIETTPSGVNVYRPGPDTLRPVLRGGSTTSTVDSGPSTQSEKTAAAKSAANDWVAATQAVQSTSTDDPKAWSDAIKAQSEASRAATKAIREASGWGTDNYNPNWRDAAEGGLMTTEKPKKKTRKYNKGGLAGKK